MSDNEPLIRFEGVHRSFGTKKVLRGLDLGVRRGETYVIIGRSGTGKSVTLKHIVGLVRPNKGKVLVDGLNVHELGNHALLKLRTRFGYLFQSGALINWMSVGENVALPLVEHTKLKPGAIRAKVGEALSLVGLEGNEGLMPSVLSGGMRKRVGLARAIVLEPEIILYDEPTTGLDPVTTSIIDRLILRMQERLGITSIVVSHDMTSAYRVASPNGRIGMLHDGKLIFEGSADDVRTTDDPIVRQFIEGNIEGPLNHDPRDQHAVDRLGSGIYRKGRWVSDPKLSIPKQTSDAPASGASPSGTGD
jgi:phospholipid/cholesterol/gamma-HCH transport system ATP-binding protein